MKKLQLLFLAFLLINPLTSISQNPDYSVFQVSNSKSRKWILYKDNCRFLYRTITSGVFEQIEERNSKVSKLKTADDWIKYRDSLKTRFFASLNKFQKTPLNAKTTGTINKKDFKIEKILFESHPGFYVTGCLYIPKKRQKPAPAVIYLSGHTDLSFRTETYQHVILNLVDKGFILFAFDPIGQGERLQYTDEENNRSKIGGPTTEHSYAGIQTLLTGTSLSDYFIWDGVRAIDYLATRKEVDMKRIGITGRSGGGTQTAMIAAYDDRILAAASECYITNFKRLLQSIGPQDAEQNPWHALEQGFDFPDYFHLRAPKPSLIVTTTLDFFSQQGARETYAEAQRSYPAMGSPGNMMMVEDFGGHESTKKNRESVYAFFQKYLSLPGNSTDAEVETFKPGELRVTKTGQVTSSLNSKTVFDLNLKYFKKKQVPNDKTKGTIKDISGITFDKTLTSGVFTGEVTGMKYNIEKYFLENNKDHLALPVWVVKAPEKEIKKIIVWITPDGKEKILQSKLLDDLIQKGYTVISADMPGIGELFDPGFKGDGFVKKVPFNYTFGAQLTGRSITGIMADNIDLLMQFTEKFNSCDVDIFALIEGVMNEPLLHYTTFKNPFSKIVFLDPLKSGENLIKEKYYDPALAYYVVPGSLPYYDIKDMLSFLPDSSLLVIDQDVKTNIKDAERMINFFEK